LAAAYSMIPVAQEDVQHGIDRGNLSAQDAQRLDEVMKDMHKASSEIARYRESLGPK
jgi:hypothetical protein